MSDNIIDGQGQQGSPRPPGVQGKPGPLPLVEMKPLIDLWLKSTGAGVTAMGLYVIISGLRLRADNPYIPIGYVIGMLLVGASFALAGRGLSEGYVWAFPLAAMSCLFHFIGWLLLLMMAGLYYLIKLYTEEFAFNSTVPQAARTAWGLWVAAFIVYLITLALTID